MSILVPEIELHSTLKAILNLIRYDYENRTDKNDTLLYKLLENNRLQRYELYEQAKKVFLSKEDDPRYLDVQMFFNLNRASIPTIHITLPSEQSGQDGLGIDEGYREYDEVPEIGNEDQQQTRPTYTRRFDTTYNIIITSDNSNEVILIYHLLRAILIPVFDHLNQIGIENCKLSGRDIQAYNTLVPQHIFMRGIGLSFSYEVSSLGIFNQDIIQKLIFNQELVVEIPTIPQTDCEELMSSITETDVAECIIPNTSPLYIIRGIENSSEENQNIIKAALLDNSDSDIPQPCLDATAILKDTIGGVISTTSILSGDSEDIIAPNAIAVLKDTDNNMLSTTSIKSNSSENIVAPDATVNVNGNLFDTVASGGTLEVPVEYENGTPVGTIAGGVVEIPNPIVCADATAVIKDSVGTTLKTEAIPSGASEDIIISDGNCEVFNTALDMVAQGSITAEGYLSLEAPDGIVRVRKSDSVLISSQSVPSGGLVNYNVADSTININSSLFTTVKATETANIPVKNTAVDNVGSDISGTWRIADATIQNSDASYTTTVKAEGTKILPDITLTQPNGVGETKKSVINLSCTQINALANTDLISQLTTGQVVAIAEGRMTPMPVNPNAHQLHSSVLPASSVTGDWRDQYNNGRLSHPTYTNLSRVYMLSDALNFLSYTPNPFGHLKRFTGRTGSYYDEVSNTWKDKNSGAVASHVLAFPDGIIYDHYTGRAWHHNLALYTGINFATIVSNAAALTTHELTWRVPTLLEFSSIAINTMTNPSGLSYSTHFNTTTAKIFTHNTATQLQWTANVDPTITANNYCMRSTTTANLIVSDIRTSSLSRGGTVCANFNTSDLTL